MVFWTNRRTSDGLYTDIQILELQHEQAGKELGQQNDKETKNNTFVLSRYNLIGKQINFVYNAETCWFPCA